MALAHAKNDYFILEIESLQNNPEKPFLQIYQKLKYVMARIEACTGVEEACKVTINELKRFSGFDSVLLYQFDEDWNGTVLAETNTKNDTVYLGLKFPASDIPKQAREMYLKNIYRLIPNRSYNPVRLYPVINPSTQTFIDLSDCNIRAVAAVHLEYMQNMNVEASMSIRIIKDEKLWGLISCHHSQKKYLSYEDCSVFELISTVISNKISSLLNNEEFVFKGNLSKIKDNLLQNLYLENDIFNAFFKDGESNIVDLFGADGAAIFEDQEIKTIGKVPQNDEIDNLGMWLQSRQKDKIFVTNCLSEVYEDALEYKDIASGIIAIPIDLEGNNFLILFKPEVIYTINWGGNPNEAIVFDNDGKKYHPRNSFLAWKEIVKKTSINWHPAQIEVAKNLRNLLLEFNIKNFN